MTDKTPTADDFANAEFARHPDRGIAARIRKGKAWAWIAGPMQELLLDDEMARDGWSPVRECPDPEQHSDGLPDAVDALTEALKNVHKRAEKAEKERDEARAELRLHALREKLTPTAESRSLTPDAITDEMLYRGLSAYYNIETTTARWDADRAEDFRRALAAALTEPPKRPDAADDLAGLLDDYGMDDFEERDLLAEWLAEHGVRVVAEDGAA